MINFKTRFWVKWIKLYCTAVVWPRAKSVPHALAELNLAVSLSWHLFSFSFSLWTFFCALLRCSLVGATVRAFFSRWLDALKELPLTEIETWKFHLAFASPYINRVAIATLWNLFWPGSLEAVTLGFSVGFKVSFRKSLFKFASGAIGLTI